MKNIVESLKEAINESVSDSRIDNFTATYGKSVNGNGRFDDFHKDYQDKTSIEINLGNFNLTNYDGLFEGMSNLKEIKFIGKSIDGGKETIVPKSCTSMFAGCSSLETVSGVINLEECTNLTDMFKGCKKLKNIKLWGIQGENLISKDDGLNLQDCTMLDKKSIEYMIINISEDYGGDWKKFTIARRPLEKYLGEKYIGPDTEDEEEYMETESWSFYNFMDEAGWELVVK